jgi:hypothetical protein
MHKQRLPKLYRSHDPSGGNFRLKGHSHKKVISAWLWPKLWTATHLKNFVITPLKAVMLPPIDVISGPLLARAGVSLFMRRATEVKLVPFPALPITADA